MLSGYCRFVSTRFLPATALLLGCLATLPIHGNTLASDTISQSIAKDAWTSRKTRSSPSEVLSPRTDDGVPALPLFEQAFTATFNSKESEQVSRTLSQLEQLTNWVERTPQLDSTEMAFLPELGNSATMEIVHMAVKLNRISNADSEGLMDTLEAISANLLAAAATSPWRGFPATRRILLGAILQKRIDVGGRFSASVETAVDALLLQLFKLHKASAAARGAVQFFHVSKSGGTNLCQAAGANGCTSQGFDTRTNCLIRDFADQPRWVSYNAHKFLQYRMSSRQGLPWFVNFHSFRPPYTCAQRRAYLLRDGLNFYANEYTNPPAASETITTSETTTATTTPSNALANAAEAASSRMCEQDFVNLIMVRHPYDRLRSQIGWVQKLYKEYYLDVDTQPAFVNRTSGFWERLMPAGVNNYYVRSLLGSRFFEFPVLEVTHQHAALAKLAVLQHDILLVLEDKARSEMALRLGLGWATAGLRDDAVRSSSELGDEVALPLDYSQLLARNAPDVELYSFAREMQALDALLWNFVAVADVRLGGTLTGSSGGEAAVDTDVDLEANAHCGYVSMGSPQAEAALEERLRDVEVPPKALSSPPPAVAASPPPPSSLATAAGAGASAGSSSSSGSSGIFRFSDSSILPLGNFRLEVGEKGPSVVPINRRNGRRLLRLKTLQGWARQRKLERADDGEQQR